MECGGLVIYHLRLESGCFKLPVFDEESGAYHTSWQELMLMVRLGSDSHQSKEKKVQKKREKADFFSQNI
jgi:hypothetical protein